jgi:hypothetical protein
MYYVSYTIDAFSILEYFWTPFLFIDKISARDMIRMSMKNNAVFGIEGYNLPKVDYPI